MQGVDDCQRQVSRFDQIPGLFHGDLPSGEGVLLPSSERRATRLFRISTQGGFEVAWVDHEHPRRSLVLHIKADRSATKGGPLQRSNIFLVSLDIVAARGQLADLPVKCEGIMKPDS